MQDNKIFKYIDEVLKNMPTSWLNLTTHRLDIYDEKLAKTGFLKQFKSLFDTGVVIFFFKSNNITRIYLTLSLA